MTNSRNGQNLVLVRPLKIKLYIVEKIKFSNEKHDFISFIIYK